MSGVQVQSLMGRESLAPKEVLEPMVKEIESDLGNERDPAGISVKTAVSLYLVPTHGFDASRNRAVSQEYGASVVSPFYDRELYDIGLSVPWYFKTPLGVLSKPLLRKVAIRKNLLPKDVVLLRKMGLGSSRTSLTDTQVIAWASRELWDWMTGTVRENLGLVERIISGDQVRQMMAKKEVRRLFRVLQLTLWYKRYIGERKVGLSSF